MNDVIITGFSNPTSEGVTIQLNKAARLKTGTGHFQEFWISWDKIGAALIDDYTEKQEVSERNKLRSQSPSVPEAAEKAIPRTPNINKPFIVANVRTLLECYEKEQYSFSRMVEIMNDMVTQWQSSPVKSDAVEFGEWIKNSPFIVVDSVELGKEAWVNCKENEVLIHGSDWHFTNLINEVGLTTEQLYQLFLQSKTA